MSFRRVAGVDEAGRGPLAGPVAVAAVILDPQRPIVGLGDSKALSEARREALAPLIRERALDWRVILVYALRNALLPVLTIAGIVFSTMLGANVLVEKVFSWPGVASYALDALQASDYAPVQGFVLLMASIFVVVNLVIDILYGIADPRAASE